jgi:hypothetical protein
MTKYIALTGPHNSGKTTAATALGNALMALGYSVKHDSFSFPVLAYAENLLDYPALDLEMTDPIEALSNKSLREFIQREQQHMRFNYGPRVLGVLLRARIEGHKPPMYCVVDDGVNANDVLGLGQYVLVDVARKSVESAYPFTIPGADFYVRNDGSEDRLRLKMQQLAPRIIERLSNVEQKSNP